MLQLPADRDASREDGSVEYERHRPERTLLYQLVKEYYPAFEAQWAAEGRVLPDYVRREFDDYLRCGRLESGFLRVRCGTCHAERLVAFSCKRRGFCPSCGARHMAESAALLVDEVFPLQPLRQWVLSFPYPLRFLFASRTTVMGRVLGIVYRTIATHLIKKAGFARRTAQVGQPAMIGWILRLTGMQTVLNRPSIKVSLFKMQRLSCQFSLRHDIAGGKQRD